MLTGIAHVALIDFTGLKPLDLSNPDAPLGVDKPKDFTWNQLLGFDACVQCGKCEAACPAFAAGQPLNPKKLIQDMVVGLAGVGPQPQLPAPEKSLLPTVDIAPAEGWAEGTMPRAPQGFRVTALAKGLQRALRRFRLGESGGWAVYLPVAVDLMGDGLMVGIGSAVSTGVGLMLALSQVVANVPGGVVTIANLRDNNVRRSVRIAAASARACQMNSSRKRLVDRAVNSSAGCPNPRWRPASNAAFAQSRRATSPPGCRCSPTATPVRCDCSSTGQSSTRITSAK